MVQIFFFFTRKPSRSCRTNGTLRKTETPAFGPGKKTNKNQVTLTGPLSDEIHGGGVNIVAKPVRARYCPAAHFPDTQAAPKSVFASKCVYRISPPPPFLFLEANTGSSGHEKIPCKLPFKLFQKTCSAIRIPSNSLHSTTQGYALLVQGKVKMHVLK